MNVLDYTYWLTYSHAFETETQAHTGITQILFDYLHKHTGEMIQFEGSIEGGSAYLSLGSEDPDAVNPDDLQAILDYYGHEGSIDICDELQMKDYEVVITLTISQAITVRAKNEGEAEGLASDMLDNHDGEIEDIPSNYWDIEDTDFTAREA